MGTIFLCGHGGWTPNDGYTTVPKGSSITFYTQHAKLLKGGDDYKLIAGTFTSPPDSVLGPYRSCPNMRLYPDDPDVITMSESMRRPGTELFWSNDPNGMLLSTIFNNKPGNAFIWACCRHVALREAGGEKVGFNLVEEADQYSKFDYVEKKYITMLKR